jgi:hypothetical protein
MAERLCACGCGGRFVPVNGQQRYVTPEHRERAKARARSQGPARYGSRHQRGRAALVPIVAGGDVPCSRCGERILPGEKWDLDHEDGSNHLYRGASHASCNRATNKPFRDDPERGVFWGPPDEKGRPLRWSRPWFDWRAET